MNQTRSHRHVVSNEQSTDADEKEDEACSARILAFAARLRSIQKRARLQLRDELLHKLLRPAVDDGARVPQRRRARLRRVLEVHRVDLALKELARSADMRSESQNRKKLPLEHLLGLDRAQRRSPVRVGEVRDENHFREPRRRAATEALAQLEPLGALLPPRGRGAVLPLVDRHGERFAVTARALVHLGSSVLDAFREIAQLLLLLKCCWIY